MPEPEARGHLLVLWFFPGVRPAMRAASQVWDSPSPARLLAGLLVGVTTHPQLGPRRAGPGGVGHWAVQLGCGCGFAEPVEQAVNPPGSQSVWSLHEDAVTQSLSLGSTLGPSCLPSRPSSGTSPPPVHLSFMDTYSRSQDPVLSTDVNSSLKIL